MTPKPIVTPRDAEALAAAWMRSRGFRDARLTGGSSDGGVDVWSSQALAQVKHHNKPMSRPALQQLVGARGLDHHKALLFFANENGYSQPASVYAEKMGIALFVYDIWGTVRAVNGRARQVERAGRPSGGAAGGLEVLEQSGSIGAGTACLLVVASAIALCLTIWWAAMIVLGTIDERELPPPGDLAILAAFATVTLLPWWIGEAWDRRRRAAPRSSSSPTVGAAFGDPRP